MTMLTQEQLRVYRATTFRLQPGQRVTTLEEAITFVNARGFVYFWPIKEVTMPNLWVAAAGDRPVPDEHDDPGHVTWGWKDEMLGARRWYYAKVLRKRATFIALDVLPLFYALSENYGEPDKDYLIQYEEGRMSHEAKTLYETLLTEGPLHTIDLRQKAHMVAVTANTPFNRAMDQLQSDFKVLPVGIAAAGAWRYAFVWELVHRYYVDLPGQARPIRQADARRGLIELYLRSVGAAQERDLALLFGWPRADLQNAIAALIESGRLVRAELQDRPGEWLALAEL